MNTDTYLSCDGQFRSDIFEAVAIYDDFATSYWLKEQIRFCFNTDPCDRLSDLGILTDLVRKRLESIHAGSFASIRSSKPKMRLRAMEVAP